MRSTEFEFDYHSPHGWNVATVTIDYKGATPDTGPSPEDAGEPATLLDVTGAYDADDNELDTFGIFVPVLRPDLKWQEWGNGHRFTDKNGATYHTYSEMLVRDTDVVHGVTAGKVYQIMPLKHAIVAAADEHLEALMAKGEAWA